MAHLLLDHPDYLPLRFSIHERILLLGRGAESDIRIPDNSVSRLHARLEPTTDGLRLEDLASANGTWVNGQRLELPTFVSVGDCIRIGSVDLRVVAGEPPRAVEPPAVLPAAAATTEGSFTAPPLTAPTLPETRATSHAGTWTLLAIAVLVVVGLVVLRDKKTPSIPSESLNPSPSQAGTAPTPPGVTPTPPVIEPTPTMTMTTPRAESQAAPASPMDGTEMTEAARAALESMNRGADMDPPRPPPPEPVADEPQKVPETPADSPPPVVKNPDDNGQPPVAPPTSAAKLPDTTPATHLRYRGADVPIATLMDRGLVNESGQLIGTDDDRFLVRRLYLDLLCRTPTTKESSAGVALTEGELVDRILAHPERWSTWYEDELYFMLLLDDFRPPEDRMRNLPGRLSAGQVTYKDALSEIVKSQYFNARNPGNDTYVTVVLEQLLSITVQKEPQLLEAGKKMYDGYASAIFGKRGKSQGDLVDIAMEHPAFVSTYLTRELKRLLGDAPPKTVVDPMVKRLIADPRSHDAILREVLLSPAYSKSRDVRRRKTDHQFIRGLWQDLFHRPPTYQELRNVRNATQALADPTGIRSVIVRTLLDGGKVELPEKTEVKPEAWIPEQFQRFLSRQPSQAELAAFTAAFEKNACKPSTILHALLTGTDYDHY